MQKPWDQIKVGDEVHNSDGDVARVLEVFGSGKTFLQSVCSLYDDWETRIGSICHIQEAERKGWTLHGEVEVWTPKIGESYWYIDSEVVEYDYWDGFDVDLARQNTLGVYQTKELAEAAFEKAKKAIKGV